MKGTIARFVTLVALVIAFGIRAEPEQWPKLELVRHEAEADGIGSVAVLRFSNSTSETLCVTVYWGLEGRTSVGYLFQVEHRGRWYEVESRGMPQGHSPRVVYGGALELKPDESTEISVSIPAYATGARVGIEYWTPRSTDTENPSFRGHGLGSRPLPGSRFSKQQVWFHRVLKPLPKDEQ